MSWWDVLKAPLYTRTHAFSPPGGAVRQINMGTEVPLSEPRDVVGEEHAYGFPRLNRPAQRGSPFTPEQFRNNHTSKGSNFTHFFQSPEGNVRAGIVHMGKNHYGIDHFGTRDDMQEAGLGREGLNQLRRELEAIHGGEVFMSPINTIVPESKGFWEKMAREGVTNPYGYIFGDDKPIPGPNDEVKKEAKSPAAIEHKRKYETKYESTPARKKYRRELERERRKRGVAGKGGGDMSHTKTGKIVVEDPHTNRARSHPSVGSTLKMVIVKDYYFKEPESYDEDGNPLQTTKTGKTVPLARGIANPKMKPKYNLAHPKNVALGEKGADAFAQFIGPGVMHEETHRAMEPDIRAARNELPDTMTEKEKRDWYMRAHEIGAYQGQFPGGQDAHEEAEATALGQRDSPRHPFIDDSITRFPKPIVKMVRVIKAPQMNLYGESAECALCKAAVDQQQAYASNSIFGETVCLACLQKEQDIINQQNDMMYHSEPSDNTKQMTLDGQIAPPIPSITIPVEDPAVVRDRIDANTDELKQNLTPRTNEQFAQDQEDEKARRRKLKLNAMREGQTTLPR
ncbi:MAG: hypothetical protein CMI60_12995 [Parvibaculum sp.]|nr:hypothetical protein [Parvibaculum sp.]